MFLCNWVLYLFTVLYINLENGSRFNPVVPHRRSWRWSGTGKQERYETGQKTLWTLCKQFHFLFSTFNYSFTRPLQKEYVYPLLSLPFSKILKVIGEKNDTHFRSTGPLNNVLGKTLTFPYDNYECDPLLVFVLTGLVWPYVPVK